MTIDFKNVNVVSMNWDYDQYPEFEDSFIVEAEFKDTGLELNDEQLDEVNNDSSFVYEELQNFLY